MENRNIWQIIKSVTIFSLLIVVNFFNPVSAQVPPGIVPYQGIPVLVPATLQELNTSTYCQLSYGTSGLQRSTTSCVPLNLGSQNPGFVSPSSHLIITTPAIDPLACIAGAPGAYLSTFPNIQDWDTLNYGVPRVMKLNDNNPGSYPCANAVATYYFIPTESQNVLVFWFSFVTQSVPLHDMSENALFRVEMTDANGNYVTGDYEHSTFYIIPETSQYPAIHPCRQSLDVQYICPAASMNIDNFWADWVRLAFDLRDYIGQTVRLRVIASECVYQAHYTYAYFTGYGLNGTIDVQACGDDNIVLKAPSGFENYVWYVNNVHVPTADGFSTLTRIRNTSETEFRCEMNSQTGAPFVFDATVNYYDLFPNFEWEQVFDECDNKVQFTNTSEIFKINNGGNVAQPIQYVLWDFGDNNTSTAINPTHYYVDIGTYTVNLRIWDADSICNVDTTYTITIGPSEIGTSEMAVSTCEEKLPYSFVDPLMGPNDQYIWHAEGTYQVTFPGAAWNGCDSIINVTLTIEKPHVRIEQTGDFCEEFTATLTAISNITNPEYFWNTEETSDHIIVTKHGTYSVTITDDNGCTASHSVKILACDPPVYIPSAITPSDNNGINDCIEIHSANLISSINFSVHNRFGETVYYTTDKNFKWCGEVGGKTPINVTYQYILFYTDDKGIERMKKGTITVL
jgi:PKD repeat protein